MNLLEILTKRANSKCELCSSDSMLEIYKVPPKIKLSEESALLLCNICREQIESEKGFDAIHWRCLNESIWSEYESVKVLSYRLLSTFAGEAWANDLIDQIYLDEESLEWAKATISDQDEVEDIKPTLDS